MTAAIALLSIGVFLLAIRWLGVVRLARSAVASSQKAVDVLRDKQIDDRQREKELQNASLKLFGFFIGILWRSILALCASFAPILLASLLGLATIEDVIRYLSRWDVIAITTAVFVLGYFLCLRRATSAKKGFKANYSVLDQLLHRIAFSSPAVQLTAADIEKRVLGSTYGRVAAERPIFITSLPRAGTTILLEALSRFPSTATNTYRDMPFLLAPILWSRVSRGFHKHIAARERAHGDGVQFSYDSPEAFEEVLWRSFWPQKYTDSGILLWGAEDYLSDAGAFLGEHMKKIISLRRPDRTADGRYLSKNNANIARLDLISRMFPQAKILVPIRHPLEHAVSLLRQHRNFIDLHQTDAFIRSYMADIGHYEFGELHRPIAFPETEALLSNRDPLQLDYWLAYWIAAFEHLRTRREQVILVSFEALCRDGNSMLRDICAQLEIPEEGLLDTVASIFKAPPPPRAESTAFESGLRARAEKLHADLTAAC